ncbi:GTPase [Winogradskyella sp.]|uniref:GTPase n=1 Tax=Winogradskyella sp. TaxID=1883156 RepID=UPI003F6C2B5A
MKLIFVYNANSGKINALFDAGYKLFNASTYPCSLCALTYDTFTENTTWKAFRKSIDTDMEFLHKDEFEAKNPNVKVDYPTVLKQKDKIISIVLNNEKLNTIKTVNELIEIIKTSL